MELQEISRELKSAVDRLKNAERELYKLAEEEARAEQEFRKSLHHAIMELQENGERATLIPDLARGQIADKKFERDLAERRWTAGRESLEAIKTQVSALQTIARWQEEV